MSKKNFRLASLALSAMGIVMICLVSGCGKSEQEAVKAKAKTQAPLEEVYTLEGNAYTKDPIFRAQLERGQKVKNQIVSEVEMLRQRAAAIEAEVKGDLKAAEKIAEYCEIKAKLAKLNEQYAQHQMRVEELVHARIRRAAADSKRVAAGEAKAKTISKEAK